MVLWRILCIFAHNIWCTKRENNDLRIIYANDGFYDFIGYTKEEFLHLYSNICTEIIHPDDINAIYDLIEKSLANVQVNFRVQHKDGTLRWACLNASRIGSNDGKPVYLCTIIDITKKFMAYLTVI